jgi:hypothetical protein
VQLRVISESGLDAVAFFFTTASPHSYLKLPLRSAFEDSAVAGGSEDDKVAKLRTPKAG